mmetsp:Transcript_12723/g.34679  ORF Transcript_12723/g.34679 Transcript_12723/m.34679 type:complete len:233 (+) Transcript_12723:124-822(+)
MATLDGGPNKYSNHYNNPFFIPVADDAAHISGGGAQTPHADRSKASQDQVINVGKVDGEALLQELYPSPVRPSVLQRLQIEFCVVVFLVGADAVVTGWTEPMDRPEVALHTFVVCLHLALLISIALAFFGLTSKTLFIKLGRYVQYFKAFWLFYCSFVLELLLMVAVKTYYLVLLYGNASRTAIWTDRAEGFYPLWIVQKIFLFAFYGVAVYSATTAFDVQWYDPLYFLDNR